MKHGRPTSTKDKISRKKNKQKSIKSEEEMDTLEKTETNDHGMKNIDQSKSIDSLTPKEIKLFDNKDISVNYVQTGGKFDQNKIIADNRFAFAVAIKIK